MRVCPKCGFKDPPFWRSMKYKRYTDYCHKDELGYWDPELYQKIVEAGTITIPPFRYHITKAGYIHRIALLNLANPSNPRSMEEPDMERPKHRYHPEPVKLTKFL